MSDVNTRVVLKQIRICKFQELKKANRSRKKVHITVAMTCEYDRVPSKLLAPALRAAYTNQLLNVKQPPSPDSLIEWSFLHYGTVQPGENSVRLSIT